MTTLQRLTLRCCVVALTLAGGVRASAYSVLTHEAIIDSSWDDAIKPALAARFGRLGANALDEARAYAYGGCIIQDMGYYPFGNKLFTDLTHYVRSGDFVIVLLHDARTADEYAFALGALAHYVADTEGHAVGINRAEPIIYAKVRARYGARVTYEQDPAAHLKTEFGFDVLEVARHLYPTKAFHDFIGFQVAAPLLERAFLETYGVKLADLFFSEALAIGSYRRAVSTLIPEMTKVAWESKRNEIAGARPGITREQFVYNLTRAEYAREWGSEYRRPGLFARFLSVLLKVVPKIGPFRALQFQVPPPAADADFMRSFNLAVAAYHRFIGELRAGGLALANRDFDTAQPTSPGEYHLADRAHAKLLERLARDRFATVSPALRAHLLGFYADLDGPNTMKTCPRAWKRTVKLVARLRARDYADSRWITRRN
jgi:hypothetical protein